MSTKAKKVENVEFPNPKNLKFSKADIELLTEKFSESEEKFLHAYQKIQEDKKKKRETFTPKISLVPKNELPIGKTNMTSLVETIVPPSSTNIRLDEFNFEGKRKSQSNTFETTTITESGLNQSLQLSGEIVDLFIEKLRNFTLAKERQTIQIKFVESVITQTFSEPIANHLLHNMKQRLAMYKNSFESNEQPEESTVESEQEDQETEAHTIVSEEEDAEPSSNEDENPSSEDDKENKGPDNMLVDSSNVEPQNTQKESDESIVRDD